MELQVFAIFSDIGLKTSMCCAFWSPFPYVDRIIPPWIECVCLESTVARSHQGFSVLGQFQKKIQQNTENFLHSQFSIFTCSEKEIFFIQPKFKTPKNDLLAKLLLKKLRRIRKYFPAPTLPLFVKIGGRRATNFPGPKVTFSGPFWVILHKFWTLVNSIRKVNNDERVHSMYTFVEPPFPPMEEL